MLKVWNWCYRKKFVTDYQQEEQDITEILNSQDGYLNNGVCRDIECDEMVAAVDSVIETGKGGRH